MESENREQRKVRNGVGWMLIAVTVVLVLWQGSVAWRLQSEATIAKEAQDRERIRAELIIISSPYALVMCNSQHNITVANPAAEQLLGWDRTEMVGNKVEMLLPKRFHVEHVTAMAEASRRAKSMPGDWMIRKNIAGVAQHREGHEIPIDLSIRVIKYKGNIEFIAAMRRTDVEKPPPVEVKPLPPVEPIIQESQQRTEEEIKTRQPVKK